MSLLIKNWSEADWKELLKWAQIGANNAMIGEYAEVEELPPHGDLIDRAALLTKALPKNPDAQFHCVALKDIDMAPTIIPASGGNE